MASDILEGKWKQLTGSVKETWGKLTDDDLMSIDGKREKLLGILQERYGYDRARAESELNKFMSKVDEKTFQR